MSNFQMSFKEAKYAVYTLCNIGHFTEFQTHIRMKREGISELIHVSTLLTYFQPSDV